MAHAQLRMPFDAPAPAAVMRRTRAVNVYEGGAQTRRTVGWKAPTVSPNAGLLGTLTTLRDRSRAAVRNDGYAKSVIDKLVSNIVGTGIKPLSQCPDAALRTQIHALWTRWTDESDADGMLDFYGQQTQSVRCWLEGGETFARKRARLPEDGLSVPFQVQLLEPELCPHGYTVQTNGRRVRAGIEFDGIGRRTAYWFYPYRPEQDDASGYSAGTLRRVPASNVVHLFDPLRPGQLRGVPHLTQALIDLYELDKYEDATLLRQQLANLFAAFLRRPVVTGDAAEYHPLTGAVPESGTDADGDTKPMLALEPGIFQELEPGEEVAFSNPPAPNGYGEFMRQSLNGVAAATGVPYEVITGDMRGVNDRTVRVILHEFRRRVQAMQHNIVVFQFCRPIFRDWMDQAVLSGALAVPSSYFTDPEPWLSVKWIPQGWPYMHPVQDVQAQKEAVRAGFRSRSAVVSEQGEDAEVIDAEQASDNARADALALRYDSDGRQGASASAAPAMDPPADPAQTPNEVPA